MKTIEETLRQLGVPKTLRGYWRLIVAVRLAREDESRLLDIVAQIYRPTASACRVDWRALEHSIRVVIHHIWIRNRSSLFQIAGYPLPEEPTASEFISILVAYLDLYSAGS